MSPSPTPPVLSTRVLRRSLAAGAALVCSAGVAIELAHARSHAPSVEALVELLSLSHEANLPTWYSSTLLLLAALLLGRVALLAHQARDRWRGHWSMLAAGFVAMSLDEAVQLHEHLGGLSGLGARFGGVLYFDWIVVAAPLLAAGALLYLPFVRALPRPTRRRFVAAGLVYLGGAVLMELPLGAWAEHHGTDNLGYGLIDAVEESLEIAGVSLFVLACWRHSYPEAHDAG